MSSLSDAELDAILKKIDSGAYGEATYKPERLPAEPGLDMISIPNESGTNRRVFERKKGKQWSEVPYLGGNSKFE